MAGTNLGPVRIGGNAGVLALKTDGKMFPYAALKMMRVVPLERQGQLLISSEVSMSGVVAFNYDTIALHELSWRTRLRLDNALTNFVAAPAAEYKWLVVDDGHRYGLGEIMGQASNTVWTEKKMTFPLFGIVPGGRIGAAAIERPEQLAGLPGIASFHSHLIVSGDGDFGRTIAFVMGILGIFSNYMPVVSVIVNGGNLTGQQVLYNIGKKRHMIVLTGTGGFADLLTHPKKTSTPFEQEVAETVRSNRELFRFVDILDKPKKLASYLKEFLLPA